MGIFASRYGVLLFTHFPYVTVSHCHVFQDHSQQMDDEDEDTATETPLFSCQHGGCQTELHTHAFAEHVIYHIGWEAFTTKGSHNLHLTEDAAKHWNSLTKPAAQKTLAKLPKLKIPGGKMSR